MGRRTVIATASMVRLPQMYDPSASVPSGTMSYDLIAVLLIGHPDAEIASKLILPNVPGIEADDFDCVTVDDDRDLGSVVAKQRSQVIFTFGPLDAFPNMHAAPFEVRK